MLQQLAQEGLMNLFRTLRVGAGVGLALGTTGVMALAVILIGVPYKLGVDWWAPWRSPFEFAPRLWAWIVYEACYVRCLGVRTAPYGTFELSREGELTLCIANHPATAAVPPFIRHLTRDRGVRLVFVAKSGHLWNIFLGVPMWILNSAVFINREDRAGSLERIRRALRGKLRGPTVFVIFPDQHRPTEARIAADVERFGGRVQGLAEWLNWTPMPRSGGLLEVLRGVLQPVPVLDFTHVLGACRRGVEDAGGLFGSTYHIHCRALASTDLPREATALQNHLVALWREKNELLARWAQSA